MDARIAGRPQTGDLCLCQECAEPFVSGGEADLNNDSALAVPTLSERRIIALAKIRSGAETLAEEFNELRSLCTEIAKAWVIVRKRVPLDPANEGQTLMDLRELMHVNALLMKAKASGLVREVDLEIQAEAGEGDGATA